MFRKIKRYWYNFTHPIIGEVWQLHRVTDDYDENNHYAKYDITPNRLETLIIEYIHRGYQFVSIDYIYNRIIGMKSRHSALLSSKVIAITLDDGYADNYEVAYPIFKKYNVPFCIYVATGYLGKTFGGRNDHPIMLNNLQLQELSQSPLCTIGGHTTTHPNMTNLNRGDQEREIVENINTLERIIGKGIIHYSLPYGVHNDSLLSLLTKCGIKTHVNAWGGKIRLGVKPLSIPRVIIEEYKIRN